MVDSLTNADFRTLLNASDRSVLTELTTHRKRKKSGIGIGVGGELKKENRKQKYLQFQKLQKKDNEKEAKTEEVEERPQDDSSYKDRAAGRRLNAEEYAQVAEEFNTQKERSIAESKFLGGDVTHTHLVKGLDFSLLAKVREELHKKVRSVFPEPVSELKTTSRLLSPRARKILRLMASELHPHQSSYKEKLDRIQRVLQQGARFKGNTQNFLPGRMLFEFRLRNPNEDSESDVDGVHVFPLQQSSDIPVAIFHSRVDCAHLYSSSDVGICGNSGLVSSLSPDLMSEIAAIVQWQAQNKKKGQGRRRRVSNAPWTTTRRPATFAETPHGREEDDIFPNVGRFEVEKAAPKEAATAAETPKNNRSAVNSFLSKSAAADASYLSENDDADDAMCESPPQEPVDPTGSITGTHSLLSILHAHIYYFCRFVGRLSMDSFATTILLLFVVLFGVCGNHLFHATSYCNQESTFHLLIYFRDVICPVSPMRCNSYCRK